LDDYFSLAIWCGGFLALVTFLILSAFFSGAETALFSLNKLQLKKMQREEEGNQAVKAILKLLDDPQRTLIAILTGNMFVNIAASSLATYLTVKSFGSRFISISTILMIFLVMVFGEIIPKTLALSNAERISRKVAKPLDIIASLVLPIVHFLQLLVSLLYKFLGKRFSKRKQEITEDDLITLIDAGKDEGIIKKEEEEMIKNIFEFGETTVKEIMIPRVDIVCIPSDIRLNALLDLINKIRHSRFPVYEEVVDNIIGILYTKDLLSCYELWYKDKRKFNLRNIIRKAYFVPENKKIDDLLDILQKNRIQIAVVIDEYGGTAGLITLEDVIEEIVGEIIDEYDKERKLFEVIDENTIIADGMMEIDQVRELVNIEIPEDDFETLGGFIYHLIGKVPLKGEIIKYKNLDLIIERVVKNRIRKVKIIRNYPESEEEIDE